MILTVPFVNQGTYKWALAPFGINIKRVRGVYTGTTNPLYLQMFNGTQNSPTDVDISLPSNGSAALEEFQIASKWNFDFDVSYDPITDAVAPVIWGLSTTPSVLVAATGESLIDIFFDVEVSGDPLLWTGYLNGIQQVPSGYTLYTNNALSAVQQIWADSTTPHELLEIVAYQNAGTATNPGGNTVAYLKLFTQTPTTGVTQPFMTLVVVNNQTAPFARFVFGANVGNGLIPQTSAANVLHQGLFVSMETAGGVYNSANVVAYKIQVKYK